MNLFIGNLNPQTTEDSLRVLFSEFGEIVSVKIPIDTETGLPRGFGFVEMADKFESFDAIDNIDGIYFEGQVISVKESKPKNAPGGNNRGGGGFNRGGGGNSRGGGGGFNRGGSGGGFNRDRSGGERSGGGGFNRDRSGGDRSGGGGFNRDRSSGDRSGGGGFNRDRSSGDRSGGGGFNRDRSSGGGFNRERSSGDRDNSYRRPYNNDQPGNDSNSGAEDPNKQPGRRFSPRGPRPSNDN